MTILVVGNYKKQRQSFGMLQGIELRLQSLLEGHWGCYYHLHALGGHPTVKGKIVYHVAKVMTTE